MTVSSTTNKVVIAGNGVTTVFSYNFQINSSTDAQVIFTDATGVSTTLSSTLYSISNLGSPTGGTVTYPLVGSPIATGTSLTITRQLALTQPTSIANQGAFYPTAVEGAIDRVVMEIQQVSEQIGRTLTAPITDAAAIGPLPSATTRANKALVFDASGNPVAGVMPASGVISAPMAPVVAAASLAAGRTAFGLGSLSLEGIGKGLQDDGAGNARVNFILESKNANYNVLSTDHGERYIVQGPITFTLPATSTLWNGFEFMVDVYTGTLTLSPNAADRIEANSTGANSYVPSGSKAYVCTDGGGFWYVRRIKSYFSAVTPGGYLTLNPNNPTIVSDITATTIYYNQDTNGYIPIYDGTEWIEYPFTSLSCALNASAQALNTIHDVFVTLVSGVPTLVVGPPWRQPGFGFGSGGFTSLTNATPIVCTAAGHGLVNGDDVWFSGVVGNTAANGFWTVSGVAGAAFTLTGSVGNGLYSSGTGTFASRGVGSGTSQLVKNGGFYVNSVQINVYNGVTPYTISAGLAIYVGSILIDGTAGQVTCNRSYGQSRKFGLWNAYNRKTIILKSGDSTASWSYTGSAFRASNNNNANSCIVFCGLPEEQVSCLTSLRASSGAGASQTSVGFAQTACIYPIGAQGQIPNSSTASMVGQYTSTPFIGIVFVVPQEFAAAATTFYGTEGSNLLTVSYRG
jgi:hypothetical protein